MKKDERRSIRVRVAVVGSDSWWDKSLREGGREGRREGGREGGGREGGVEKQTSDTVSSLFCCIFLTIVKIPWCKSSSVEWLQLLCLSPACNEDDD